MDKASILGETINYLKQLQEQVKTLEEEAKKKPIESVVVVKKLELNIDSKDPFSDENSRGPYDEPLPEIEARVREKSVFIRIHCEKRKGIVEKTVAVIEKLHLSITNSSVMSFGSSVLDITIVAQVISLPLSYLFLLFCMLLRCPCDVGKTC